MKDLQEIKEKMEKQFFTEKVNYGIHSKNECYVELKIKEN